MIIFDGLYSFISLILSTITLFISKYIYKKDAEKFPFGKHVLEPLMILIKSFVIMFMCVYSIVSAINAILIGGNDIEYGLGLVYSIISIVGCGVIYLYMKRNSKRFSSELINVESSQWLMDGLLSTCVFIGFIIAIILENTRFAYFNNYIDPTMVLIVSIIFVKMPITAFIKSFKEIAWVKADDEINNDIYILVKEIEKEYNFEESYTRVSKVGRALRIEIDFIYNKNSKFKNLDQMDSVREKLLFQMKHIKYNKWLNVSFTGDKKWAI